MADPQKIDTKIKKGVPLPLVFLLITLAILVAGGYFVFKFVLGRGENVIASLTQKAVEMAGSEALFKLTEADLKDISDPLIRKHLVKQYSKIKFRMVSGSDGRGAGSSTSTTLDYRSEKDMRMQVIQTDGGKETSNMITIGDTTYIKDYKDNAWWMEKKQPVTPEAEAEVNKIKDEYTPEKLKEEVLKKDQITYKNLGEENCGVSAPKMTCYKYEEVTGGEDAGKRVFWFDKQDLLLRKEQNSYGEFTSTATYYYDNVVVNPPSPTKPLPAGKSIYEMMYGAQSGSQKVPSQAELENMKNTFQQNENTNETTPEPEVSETDASM
jgi:hypothetical protein